LTINNEVVAKIVKFDVTIQKISNLYETRNIAIANKSRVSCAPKVTTVNF